MQKVRKYKENKKTNIISIRVTDDELEGIQQVIQATNKRASQVMREALQLLAHQWAAGNVASAATNGTVTM